ncbi:hypothetical protein LI951_12795 [Enterococcus sp. BWT-B8]|uniref:hypothetical protein n=1 Tax=Enterococcus sp. BWT-B8 TaxID=2885157 RepID=UPI001E29C1B5|nr:hypothetical protein [Enterococcus sp. BWT-B8]MCB5952948.1 hypothetical protein [Enterococcus sp. BWT-B8]
MSMEEIRVALAVNSSRADSVLDAFEQRLNDLQLVESVMVEVDTGDATSEVEVLIDRMTQLSAESLNTAGIVSKKLNNALKSIFNAAAEASGQDNFSAVMQRWKEAVENIKAAFGQPLLEPFTKMIEVASDVVNRFADFLNRYPAIVYTVTGALVVFAAALKSILIVNSITTAIGPTISALRGFKTMLMGVGGAGGLLASPIFLAVAAITALAVILYTAYQRSETFRNVVQAVFEYLKVATAVVIEKVKNFRASVIEAFTSAYQNSEMLRGGMAVVFEFIKNILGTVTEKLSLFKEAILQAFQSGDMSGLLEIFKNLIPTIIGFILGGIPKLLIMGTKMIASIAEGMGISVPELLTMVVESIMNVIMEIINMLPSFIETGAAMLTGLIEGIAGMLPGLVDAGIGIITGLLTAILENLSLLVESGVALLNALIEGLMTALPFIVEAVIVIVTTFVALLIENLPMLLNAGIKILLAIIAGLLEVLPALLEAAVTILTALVFTLIENRAQIIEVGITLVWALIEGLIAVLPQLIATAFMLLTALVFTLIKNLPRILSVGVQLITALITGLLSMLGQLLGAIGNLMLGILSKIGEFLGQMLIKGIELITNLINGIGQKISEAGTKAGEIARSVIDGVTGFVKDMKNAGVDLTMGFINGIDNMITEVKEKAAALAKGAVDTVKKWLRIASPSKVMIQMGEWTGEGFGAGIEAMIAPVSKLSKKLAEAATIDAVPNADLSNMLSTKLNNELGMMNLSANPELLHTGAASSALVAKYDSAVSTHGNNQPPMYFEATFEADGREIAKGTAKFMKPEIDRINRADARLGGERI